MNIDNIAAVPALLRAVAERVVMPRFRRLRADDIADKGAGELVTVADRETEAALAAGLTALFPAARMIGEEACADDPGLLASLAEGWTWLVDPIDGTANYAAGQGPFALMVALLDEGVTRASWILDPVGGEVASARLGYGARLDERPLLSTTDLPADEQMTGIVSQAFVPPDCEHIREQLVGQVGTVLATRRCAGFEYPQVARGECDFALYWRTLPWDHAPGALLVQEVGGIVCHLDGEPYSALSSRPGLLVARNPQVADRVLAMMR